VIHDILRDHPLGLVEVPSSGIEISVETRKVAARHLEPNAVALGKIVTDGAGLKKGVTRRNSASFNPAGGR
jgi:hypothetical protein